MKQLMTVNIHYSAVKTYWATVEYKWQANIMNTFKFVSMNATENVTLNNKQ